MSTIQQRLSCGLFVGWTLVLIAGGSLVYAIMNSALTRQFDELLLAKAVNLSTVAEQRNGSIEMDPAEQFLRGFEANTHAGFFQIWNAEGATLARSKSLHNDSLPQRYGSLQTPVIWNLALPDGRAGRALGFKFKPIMDDAPTASSRPIHAILVVAVGRETLDRPLTTLRWVLAGSSALILAVTALIVPLVLRRELAPLNQLADQASQISASTLSARFSVTDSRGELMPIVSRLNDLLHRLELAFERERQFSNDVAHEFRTPIAELRSFVELAIKWPDSRDAETDHNILAITQQMEAIINRLLAMARSQPGQIALALEKIDLAELAETVCQTFEGQISSRDLTLQKNIPPTLELRSDPILLRSILSNLVSNAVEYAPPHSVVQLKIEANDSLFTLRIVNVVENLSHTDLPHLFDRFWRKDSARTDSSHSGLGLPLSRAFATCLGYSLNAEMNDGNCLSMTLAGPATLK